MRNYIFKFKGKIISEGNSKADALNNALKKIAKNPIDYIEFVEREE